MNRVDKAFYPGWVRKAVTFTIDDGNITFDRKFIEILSRVGICGTFNLCFGRNGGLSNEEMRELYRGFEISNHCKHHPFALDDDVEYKFASALMTDDAEEDPTLLYPSDIEGIYNMRLSRGSRGISPASDYCRFVDEGRAELEEVFGKGNIGGFVWPYSEQNNKEVKEHLLKSGYYGVRKTGCLRSTTRFSLPADRFAWSYNADHDILLSVMAEYEAYPDDGELKFFSFGVHSKDYETFDKWSDLERFAEVYGNRSDEFYYASVGDIFAYEDAVNATVVTDDTVTNNSALTVYIKVDGIPMTVSPGESIKY